MVIFYFRPPIFNYFIIEILLILFTFCFIINRKKVLFTMDDDVDEEERMIRMMSDDDDDVSLESDGGGDSHEYRLNLLKDQMEFAAEQGGNGVDVFDDIEREVIENPGLYYLSVRDIVYHAEQDQDSDSEIDDENMDANNHENNIGNAGLFLSFFQHCNLS